MVIRFEKQGYQKTKETRTIIDSIVI